MSLLYFQWSALVHHKLLNMIAFVPPTALAADTQKLLWFEYNFYQLLTCGYFLLKNENMGVFCIYQSFSSIRLCQACESYFVSLFSSLFVIHFTSPGIIRCSGFHGRGTCYNYMMATPCPLSPSESMREGCSKTVMTQWGVSDDQCETINNRVQSRSSQPTGPRSAMKLLH